MPVGPFLDHSEQAVRTAVEVNFYGVLTGCRLVLPGDGRAQAGPHRQHRLAGGHAGRARPGTVRGHQVRGGGAVHRAGRRVRATGCPDQLCDADIHQHRADRGHQRDRGDQAGPARTSPRRWSRPWTTRKPLSPCPIRFGSSPPRPRSCRPVDAVGCRRRWAPTASSWTSTPTPGRPTNSARRRPPVCWSPEDAEVGLADPGRGVAVPVGFDRRDVFDQHVGADRRMSSSPAAPTSAKLTRSGKSSSSPDVVNHTRVGFHCLVVEFGDRRRVDPAGQSLQREVGVERPARCAIHSSNTVAACTSSTTSGGYSSSGA